MLVMKIAKTEEVSNGFRLTKLDVHDTFNSKGLYGLIGPDANLVYTKRYGWGRPDCIDNTLLPAEGNMDRVLATLVRRHESR